MYVLAPKWAAVCFLTPESATTVFTGILTLATIVYAIFTYRLWQETRKSADAAAKLAQSAKESADAAIELNRPILSIAEVLLVPLSGVPESSRIVVPGARHIVVTLKNSGSVYAKEVMVHWKSYMQAENETRNNSEQGPIDIAQDTSCPINLSVLVKSEDTRRIQSGAENYKIKIEAEYSAPYGKRRWRYTAVRVLRTPSTFSMDDQRPDRTMVVARDL